MLRPPTHSIEALAGISSTFVWGRDPAWDMDRVEREEAEHFPAGDHPVRRYLAGETRYDLEADGRVGGEVVTPRTYLRGKATEFRLRRLRTGDCATIADWARGGADMYARAMHFACQAGVASIENLEIPWESRNGELTDATMRALYDLQVDGRGVGLDLILAIGAAVWELSKPLSDAEKKP